MNRQELLALIDLMINLDDYEKEELKALSDSELEERYKLYLLEKNEEML